jgi:hypothetical protein
MSVKIETIVEINRLCKLLAKRCDVSAVKITARVDMPRMYELMPDGTYRNKYYELDLIR